MTHYVCPACHGVSEQAKNCETDGCTLNGQPLKECNCEDGNHQQTQQAPQGEK